MTKSARPVRRKYRNVKVTQDGVTYDSTGEYRRWCALQQLARAGVIRDLARHPTFVLAPKVVIQGKTKRALTYRADFGYTVVATGEKVVEDFKGVLTAVYKIKRHLMMHLYGIAILETRR
jgi:hypothetical protein